MVLVLSKWGDSGSAFDPRRFHVSSYFQVLTNPPSVTACMLFTGAAGLRALPACMQSPIYLSDEFECEKLLICDLVLGGGRAHSSTFAWGMVAMVVRVGCL